MASTLIGAQMYTLRDHCKTPGDIAASCARVKAMGYDGIQASALGPIEPAELKRILDGEGLACAATHTNPDRLRNETRQVIEEHQLWNCRYTAIGGFFPGADTAWNRDLWLTFAQGFNDTAATLKGSDLYLGYHNHSHELAPIEDQTPLDLLVRELDPAIWFEIDTYWIAHGGGDPAAWIDRVAGRIPCVHVKDLTITRGREHKMCEVGDGNLNWPRILTACASAGVDWYLVERDSGDMDPFESLARSHDNLRQMLA
ncbi:MAG: sugar phosphate isomerase/epimerase [Verrucomicrobia bacterium]|nr:sugar phosphate isomerase/epimerase [Verrucomicrobiota bacterium]